MTKEINRFQIGSIVSVKKAIDGYDDSKVFPKVSGTIVALEKDATIVLFDGQDDILDVRPDNLVLENFRFQYDPVDPNALIKAKIRNALYNDDYFDVVRLAIQFASEANLKEEREDQLSYSEFKNLVAEAFSKVPKYKVGQAFSE